MRVPHPLALGRLQQAPQGYGGALLDTFRRMEVRLPLHMDPRLQLRPQGADKVGRDHEHEQQPYLELGVGVPDVGALSAPSP
jgi:hypothetical protein